MAKVKKADIPQDQPVDAESDYLTDTLESYNAGDSREVRATDIEHLAKETLKAEQQTQTQNDLTEEKSTGQETVIDEDADNPEAGTPGHPGVDEDTA
jgi:hypothetical protein